jgi:tetratricopeptide (TPR) repeat protein
MEETQKIIHFYTEKLFASTTKQEVAFYFHQRGCVYFDRFQYDLCENDFMESLKHDDTSASLYYDLCDLYCIFERHKEAIEFGEKSIKLDPSNPLGI